MIKVQESNSGEMIKYNVIRERFDVEITAEFIKRHGLTKEDIMDFMDRRTWTAPEEYEQFDTAEEAIEYCKTLYPTTSISNGSGKLKTIEFEVFYVLEQAYDEDGEYSWSSNYLDEYYFACEEIKPESLDDEEEEVELKEDVEYPKPKTLSFEEVMEKLGITEEDLAAVGDVEIE